jgi:hypothetical protein
MNIERVIEKYPQDIRDWTHIPSELDIVFSSMNAHESFISLALLFGEEYVPAIVWIRPHQEKNSMQIDIYRELGSGEHTKTPDAYEYLKKRFNCKAKNFTIKILAPDQMEQLYTGIFESKSDDNILQKYFPYGNTDLDLYFRVHPIKKEKASAGEAWFVSVGLAAMAFLGFVALIERSTQISMLICDCMIFFAFGVYSIGKIHQHRKIIKALKADHITLERLLEDPSVNGVYMGLSDHGYGVTAQEKLNIRKTNTNVDEIANRDSII